MEQITNIDKINAHETIRSSVSPTVSFVLQYPIQKFVSNRSVINAEDKGSFLTLKSSNLHQIASLQVTTFRIYLGTMERDKVIMRKKRKEEEESSQHEV